MDQERQFTIKCSNIMQVKPLRFLLTANFCKDIAVRKQFFPEVLIWLAPLRRRQTSLPIARAFAYANWVHDVASIPGNRIVPQQRVDARIIMAGVYMNPGLLMLCEAYKEGLYGENIVWIFMNWVDTDWVDRAKNVTTCTREQILEALQQSFFTGPTFVNPSKEPGIAGITSEEFDAMYLEYFNGTMPFGSTYRMPAYDSVWAVALALNKTLTKLIESGRYITNQLIIIQSLINQIQGHQRDWKTSIILISKWQTWSLRAWRRSSS